jgi:hypothetical protein
MKSGSRLSFGSFMEIVVVIAIVNGLLPVIYDVISRGSLLLDLGEFAMLYLAGVVSVAGLGVVAFPVYCLLARHRRLCTPTIVGPQKEE